MGHRHVVDADQFLKVLGFTARPQWLDAHVFVAETSNGVTEVLTVPGMLLALARADADLMGVEHRATRRRFKRWALGVEAAESIKATPREPGDLLFDAFGGSALEEAIERACCGDMQAWDRTFARLLAERERPIA